MEICGAGAIEVICDGDIVMHIVAGTVDESMLRGRQSSIDILAHQMRRGGVASLVDVNHVQEITRSALDLVHTYVERLRSLASAPSSVGATGAAIFVARPDNTRIRSAVEELVSGAEGMLFQVQLVERVNQGIFWLHSHGYVGFDTRESLARIDDAEAAILARLDENAGDST